MTGRLTLAGLMLLLLVNLGSCTTQGDASAQAGKLSAMQFNSDVAQAAAAGDLHTMRELFRNNPEKPIQASLSGHPILLAARMGHVDIVRELLDRGVDVNYRDRAGMTPLMLARTYEKREMVDFLVDAGAVENPAIRVGAN